VMSSRKVGIAEASGLAHLDDETVLVADDERGIYICDADGNEEKLLSSKDHKSLRGLEGICMSSDGRKAYVVSEGEREVHEIAIERDGEKYRAHPPHRLGRLPKLGDVENKGWEGLDVLPGHLSQDGQDRLVAVHEGNPRKIGLFPLPDLEPMELVSLPPPFDDSLHDLSDIAVHPKTGHLFLLSDESSAIAEVAIERNHTAGPGALLSSVQLRPLGQFELPPDNDAKPEGLSFRGDELWVIGDGDHRLLTLSVTYDD